MTAASKPIRYELTIKNGTIYSLIYRAEGKPIVIEACQLINGTSLPKSRQWLTKMAERWGVPFVDKTLSVETQPEERERSAISNRDGWPCFSGKRWGRSPWSPLRPRPDGLVFWESGEEASLSLHDGKKAVCQLK